MLKKEFFDKKYFINANWLQFVITPNGVGYEKILQDLCESLEAMRQNKSIKAWFFLNKKQNILVKVEFLKKNRYKLLNFEKLLKQKFGRILIKVDIFDPETFQFGGEKGWKIAKKYFNGISLLASGGKKIEAKLAVMIIFDLLLRVAGDSFETWDILQRLMVVRGINQKYSLKDIRGSKFFGDIDSLFSNPRVFYFQKMQNEGFVRGVIKMNVSLARELERNKFSLMFSARKILPYYIIFIFNIFLIAESEQKEVIRLLSFFSNPGKY